MNQPLVFEKGDDSCFSTVCSVASKNGKQLELAGLKSLHNSTAFTQNSTMNSGPIKTLQYIIPFVFGLIFFLIGSIATIWGVKTFLSAQATEEWPQVEGKVTASEVTRKRIRGGGKGIKQRKTNYTAEISYDYVID